MTGPETNAALDTQVLEYDARLGERLAGEVHGFLGRFVAYPTEHAHIAHTLWIMHTHLMDCWDSTPRLAFLSPEPASGKTRALEVTELLVPNPVQTVNVSPAYLFRKVGNEDGATILFDEIDTIFGPKAKDHEDIRGLLNAGHRRGATTGRCIVRGRTVLTEELPAYAAVALAGLGWLPDTLLSRSIVVRMKRRSNAERVEPFRRRLQEGEGWSLRDRIASWSKSAADIIEWPSLPAEITDRNADVWEPLFSIADAVGGEWPCRARVAGVALVGDLREAEPSLGVKLLVDLHSVFADSEELPSKVVLELLHAIPESPWSDMRGKPLDQRGLAFHLRQYSIRSRTIRVGDTTPKGYVRSDFVDAWARYLPSPSTSATSATSATPDGTVIDWRVAKSTATNRLGQRTESTSDVADVADVALPSGHGPVCAHCHRAGGVFCQASVGGEPVALHVGCKDAYRP